MTLRVFNTIPTDKNLFKNPVLTIGNFDGVHMGHRKIIETLLEEAESIGGEAIILTFDTHPRKILYPDNPPPIITSPKEKIDALHSLGVNNIIMIDFTEKIADTTALEFYKILADSIDIKKIVIGYDHAFGKNRKGDRKFLEELSGSHNIAVKQVEEQNLHEKPASSTWIREEILKGNVNLVKTLLNRPYSIYGVVIYGEGRGKGLGFPTANIEIDDEDKVIPQKGVYAVTVKINGTIKKGMLNIGTNPTFGGKNVSIEVHIIDMDGNLYGKSIEIYFYKKIRDEIVFNHRDDLIAQIKIDKLNIEEELKTILL